MNSQKPLKILAHEVCHLFAALTLCDEEDAHILVKRDLDMEDLTNKACYEVTVYDSSAPEKRFKASAVDSIYNATSELYHVLYNNALAKRKNLGDVFVWAYQSAHKIIAKQEDILQD
jgi:GTPase SAR1 family protein